MFKRAHPVNENYHARIQLRRSVFPIFIVIFGRDYRFFFFFLIDPPTTDFSPLPLPAALPIPRSPLHQLAWIRSPRPSAPFARDVVSPPPRSSWPCWRRRRPGSGAPGSPPLPPAPAPAW